MNRVTRGLLVGALSVMNMTILSSCASDENASESDATPMMDAFVKEFAKRKYDVGQDKGKQIQAPDDSENAIAPASMPRDNGQIVEIKNLTQAPASVDMPDMSVSSVVGVKVLKVRPFVYTQERKVHVQNDRQDVIIAGSGMGSTVTGVVVGSAFGPVGMFFGGGVGFITGTMTAWGATGGDKYEMKKFQIRGYEDVLDNGQVMLTQVEYHPGQTVEIKKLVYDEIR